MAERQPPRKNADGTVTITLAEPVQFGSQTIAELTIRQPRGKNARRLALTISAEGARISFADVLEVLADCAGVSSAVVDELVMGDLAVCAAELLGFSLSGPVTGRT